MHSTAVGKVLLAFEEEWLSAAYLRQPMDRVAPRTVTNPSVLAEQLAQIREDGYAVTNEEQRPGACSIAVPVFHTGRIGSSIGLVVTAEKAAMLTRHVPTLRGISERIEAATARIPLETLLGSHR